MSDNNEIQSFIVIKQEEIETDNTAVDSETRLREDNTETILPDNHVIIPDTHIKQEIVEDLETRAHDDVKQEESRDVSIHYSITTVKWGNSVFMG